MEEVQPLKRSLYVRAAQLGIRSIEISISGGYDEGYVEIELNRPALPNVNDEDIRALEREFEDWVYEVYETSGAGDGTSYGDRITYDLIENTVSNHQWYYARQEIDHPNVGLSIVGEEE